MSFIKKLFSRGTPPPRKFDVMDRVWLVHRPTGTPAEYYYGEIMSCDYEKEGWLYALRLLDKNDDPIFGYVYYADDSDLWTQAEFDSYKRELEDVFFKTHSLNGDIEQAVRTSTTEWKKEWKRKYKIKH